MTNLKNEILKEAIEIEQKITKLRAFIKDNVKSEFNEKGLLSEESNLDRCFQIDIDQLK